MTKSKSVRLTLPKHHEIYLQSIASQMGVENTSEALNYLLWELRKANYQFGGQLPQYPMPNTQQTHQMNNDPSNYEKATAMSGLSFVPQSPQAIQEFEQLQAETDPVIERLLALGLESF